jgi:glyoxylase-like metal-dependent hydrolase (beta-lactamase superfamily II)
MDLERLPQSVLINDTAEHRVLAVRYAERQTSTDEAYFRNSVYGEADRDFTMAYFFWIIQGTEGTFLFDTGFSSGAAERRARTFLVDPMDALSELGIAPTSVDGVFLSHLHFDHTGHASGFPNAQVYVDTKEYEFWINGNGRKRLLAASAEEEDLSGLVSLQKSGQLTLLDGTTDVLPGIISIRVGGHTPGQHVLSVNTAGGPLLLASDALHYYDEMELDRPFCLFTELDDMYSGYELMRAFETTGARVVAGHDMAVIDRFGSEENLPYLTAL